MVCWTKANSTLRKRVGNPYQILNLRLFREISRRSIKVTLFSENHFKILLDYLPNCSYGIDDDARIYADDIYYVNRKEYVDWAIKALTVVRSVWSTFSGEGESEWRESVHKEFIKAGITPKDYLDFVCSKNLKDM